MDKYIQGKISVQSYEDDLDVLTVSKLNEYKAGIILHYDMNLEALEQITIETSYEDDIINEYNLPELLDKAKKFLNCSDNKYSYQDLLNIKNVGLSDFDKEINQAILCIVFFIDVSNMLSEDVLKDDYESLSKELKDFYLYLLDLLNGI